MNTQTTPTLPASSSLPALSDSGDGLTFAMLGVTMRLIAGANDTGGRFTVFEQVTPAGWGPPRHIHDREDEVVYVLEGTYEFSLGAERRTLSAGGCAVLPRGVPHGFRNVGESAGRFLCFVTPGGLEEFFMAVGRTSPLEPAQLAVLAKSYGMTMLPPGA